MRAPGLSRHGGPASRIRTGARRVLNACLCLLLLFGAPRPASAYLKFGYEMNGEQLTLKWQKFPVSYFVNDGGVPGVSASALEASVARAFATWQAVPTASITYTFAGVTANQPGEDDGRSTLGFLNEPTLDRVLAATSFFVDAYTGELLESDIFFNSAFPWSVAERGEAGKWDLETIALHEIGHMSGLGHSALGETEETDSGRRVLSTGAVMFPIALSTGDVSGRVLMPDDIAGISDLYPDNRFNAVTGSVSGRVTKNGQGVFGAHVVAFDLSNGEMVGNFTLSTSGSFSIAGLRPGPHVLRVEPLDDVDTDSFFDVLDPVDIAFGAKFVDRLVVVPRGGDSGPVEIGVSPK